MRSAEIDELKSYSLREEDAMALAKPFEMVDGQPASQKDPFPRIKPSLLSADDIVRYVEKTGMVAPFNQFCNEKSKLKAASFEGGIGSCAYEFKENSNKPTSIMEKGAHSLIIPANSIVFVESDLYFRLPPFIAVRFNLQIRHVHRGLLLGTGPLVDPGFWGRLCIPLHNLTDEPYEIPKSDGLIWIEFTKTTSYPKLGTPPTNTKLDDIKGAIDKATKPYDEILNRYARPGTLGSFLPWIEKPPQPVGIRSSIQTKFIDSERNTKAAKAAAETARNSTLVFQRIGYLTLLALLIMVFQLWQSYSSEITNRYNHLPAEIASVKEQNEGLIAEQAAEIHQLQREISELKREFSEIQKDVVQGNSGAQ